jgi:hypothetical protein
MPGLPYPAVDLGDSSLQAERLTGDAFACHAEAELNPAEGAWAAMKASLGNLAARDVDQLAAIMKNRLKSIHYRPALIEAFLAQAGLPFDPQRP